MSAPITVPPFPQTIIAVAPATTAKVAALVGRVIVDQETPTTTEGGNRVRSLMLEVASLRKAIDADRKATSEPFRNLTEQINEAAKCVLVPLATAEEMLKGQLAAYLEHLREQERQAARIAAEAAQAQPEQGRLTPALAALPMVEAPAIVHTRTTRDVEVFDPALVPREFLVIDMTKLRAAVLAGTPVPGAKVVEKTTIVGR